MRSVLIVALVILAGCSAVPETRPAPSTEPTRPAATIDSVGMPFLSVCTPADILPPCPTAVDPVPERTIVVASAVLPDNTWAVLVQHGYPVADAGTPRLNASSPGFESVHYDVMTSRDQGQTWTNHPLPGFTNGSPEWAAGSQYGLGLVAIGNELHALVNHDPAIEVSDPGAVVHSWSLDAGQTWSSESFGPLPIINRAAVGVTGGQPTLTVDDQFEKIHFFTRSQTGLWSAAAIPRKDCDQASAPFGFDGTTRVVCLAHLEGNTTVQTFTFDAKGTPRPGAQTELRSCGRDVILTGNRTIVLGVGCVAPSAVLSGDGGATWSPATPAPALAGPDDDVLTTALIVAGIDDNGFLHVVGQNHGSLGFVSPAAPMDMVLSLPDLTQTASLPLETLDGTATCIPFADHSGASRLAAPAFGPRSGFVPYSCGGPHVQAYGPSVPIPVT